MHIEGSSAKSATTGTSTGAAPSPRKPWYRSWDNRLAIALFLISICLAVWAYSDKQFFFKPLITRVPIELPIGFLTFDGIMIAAMVLFDTKIKSRDGILRPRRLIGVISGLFAFAAGASLHSLHGFDNGGAGLLEVDVTGSLPIAIAISFLGLFFWFLLLIYFYFTSYE